MTHGHTASVDRDSVVILLAAAAEHRGLAWCIRSMNAHEGQATLWRTDKRLAVTVSTVLTWQYGLSGKEMRNVLREVAMRLDSMLATETRKRAFMAEVQTRRKYGAL